MFRIEAPPGYEAKVKFVVQALLYLGANVMQVYLNGPVQDATMIYLVRPAVRTGRARCREPVRQPLRDSRSPTVRIEGIDVVIQLGTTFLSDTETIDTLPATTTTTTVP